MRAIEKCIVHILCIEIERMSIKPAVPGIQRKWLRGEGLSFIILIAEGAECTNVTGSEEVGRVAAATGERVRKA